MVFFIVSSMLRELKSLKINGSNEEEKHFNKFKKQLFKDASKECKHIHKELKKLSKHHHNTLRHNIMVAHDVEFIAKHLGLKPDVVRDLTIAAFLHDIGKLHIHEIILNLNDYSERKAVFKLANPSKELPKGPLMNEIFVKDIVNYKIHVNHVSKNFNEDFEIWLKEAGLNPNKIMSLSLREYLNIHQDGTRIILNKLGLKSIIVEYASTHHPSYFDNVNPIPPEARIIEVADKFNAIIQSEGVRTYTTKKSRIEALIIIAKELEEELPKRMLDHKNYVFEKESIASLMKKNELDINSEIYKDILPAIKNLIKLIKKINTNLDDNLLEKALEEYKLAVVILALHKDFNNVIHDSLVSDLFSSKTKLEQVLLDHGKKI